ncbi:hypothetical protein D3C79_995090 [compost metagenome]
MLRNDDFNDIRRKEILDGFLFSRYLVEMEPNENVDGEAYIAMISILLEGLWSAGYKAVAACDFEDRLPNKGGYNLGNR